MWKKDENKTNHTRFNLLETSYPIYICVYIYICHLFTRI